MCDDLVYEPASFSPLGMFLSCVNLSTKGSTHSDHIDLFSSFSKPNVSMDILEVYTFQSSDVSMYLSLSLSLSVCFLLYIQKRKEFAR